MKWEGHENGESEGIEKGVGFNVNGGGRGHVSIQYTVYCDGERVGA